MAVRLSSGYWSTKKGFYDSTLWFNDREDALVVTPSPMDMRDACLTLYRESGVKSFISDLDSLREETESFSITVVDVLGANTFTIAMLNANTIELSALNNTIEKTSIELKEHIGCKHEDASEWMVARIAKAFKNALLKITSK